MSKLSVAPVSFNRFIACMGSKPDLIPVRQGPGGIVYSMQDSLGQFEIVLRENGTWYVDLCYLGSAS